MWYCRVTELGTESPFQQPLRRPVSVDTRSSSRDRQEGGDRNGIKDQDDEIHDFRRVRIIQQPPQRLSRDSRRIFSKQDSDDEESLTDSQYDDMINHELEYSWKPDRTGQPQIRTGSDGYTAGETFHANYKISSPPFSRVVVVSVDYEGAPNNSLEMYLFQTKGHRERHAIIYEAIRESLVDIDFYDTATRLELRTVNGRQHILASEELSGS